MLLSPGSQSIPGKRGEKNRENQEIFAGKSELTKNDDWRDVDSVKLDAIEYQVIKDTQTGIMAYESNQADFVILSSDVVDMYRDSEDYYNAPAT